MRKFRELDDAFAEALRELEDPARQREIPTGPPVRPLETQQQEDEAARQHRFEERLRALMDEYRQPAASVLHLVETLRDMGRIA
ncbi:MAG: hypothetical protein ACOC0M_07660 [Halomonas sp.]